MTRFLFAAFPVSGHVNPGLPIARELVARGHDVRWYSTQRFRRAIESAGARWVPFRAATPIDEEWMPEQFPDRPAGGIRQLQYDIEHVFVSFIPGALLDLEHELAREPFDVIVSDNAFAAAGLLCERNERISWGVYGINPLSIPSRDTAPFGLALMPDDSELGRLRNRALYWLVDNVVFRSARTRYQQIRRAHGLPHAGRSIFDFTRRSDLYLQGSVPSFEYPRTDMPHQVRFIGAAVPEPPPGWTPPSWWDELGSGRPVILVTQGTINNDYDQLIRPAIRALGGEDTLVIVTTGSRPAEEAGIDPLPANTRVERFIPYAHLMQKVDLLVTNGGYGSIQIALAHGVPVVAIGKTEDKAEIANRVEWSGVGVGLKVLTPSEKQIRDAVHRVIKTPTYAARAEAVAYEMAGLDAGRTGAELLEELAGGDRLARSA